MNIEEQIADYKPYNEQEAHDQAAFRHTAGFIYKGESGGAYDSVIVAVKCHT